MFIGSTEASKFYLGANEVDSFRLGADEVWANGCPYELERQVYVHSGSAFSNTGSIAISEDGIKFISSNVMTGVLQYGELITPSDISTLGAMVVVPTVSHMTRFDFSPDGLIVSGMGATTDGSFARLSVPWDMATVIETYLYTISLPAEGGVFSGIRFFNDGYNVMMLNRVMETVQIATTTVPYDLTGVTVWDSTGIIGTPNNEPFGLLLSPDGKKIWVSYYFSVDPARIIEWNMSTPYDLSTLTRGIEKDVSAQTSDPSGIAFTSEGDSLLVGTDVSTTLWQYVGICDEFEGVSPLNITYSQDLMAGVDFPAGVDIHICMCGGGANGNHLDYTGGKAGVEVSETIDGGLPFGEVVPITIGLTSMPSMFGSYFTANGSIATGHIGNGAERVTCSGTFHDGLIDSGINGGEAGVFGDGGTYNGADATTYSGAGGCGHPSGDGFGGRGQVMISW